MLHVLKATIVVLMLLPSLLNAQEMNTIDDSLVYLKAIEFAKKIDNFGVEKIDINIIKKAISDNRIGKSEITSEQSKIIVNKFKEIRTQRMKEAGEVFLAENAKKEGVISLDNGMQYEILQKGEGTVSPTKADKVKTHYHGTLIDGTVFDSSVERNEPLEFGLGQVIKGWQEALSKMVVGDKWKVYIPYNLAYGERGAGGVIQPYSALIFEIELLEIL